MFDVATVQLSYEPPFDWASMLEFLWQRRAAGVEMVWDDVYARSASIDGDPGVWWVRHRAGDNSLQLFVIGPLRRQVVEVAARVRRMFDLDLTLDPLAAVFDKDPIIGPLRAERPGLRIPGAWAPFEVLMRTIVGQQVSVAAATTVASRIVERTGTPLSVALEHRASYLLDRVYVNRPPEGEGISRLYPEPEAIATGDLSEVGMPGRRVAALQTAAQRVTEGSLPAADVLADRRPPLEEYMDAPVEQIKAALMELPGIGPWTAEFFALRALRDRDAWPGSDLILQRELERRLSEFNKDDEDGLTVAQATKKWRPYRAYAAMHLWHGASRPQTS